jgi:hypothetical protein
MDWINRLKQYFATKSPDGDSPNPPNSSAGRPELRQHPRFPLQNFNLFSLNLGQPPQIPIEDISYGGLALPWSPELESYLTTAPIEAALQNLHHEQPCRLTLAHRSPQGIGLAFIHEDPSVLTFLRPGLEGLRQGYSVSWINPDIRQEAYRSADWYLYRGDGPIDLRFRQSQDGHHIVEMFLSFRDQGLYRNLRLEANRFISYQTVAERGVAPRMEPTTDQDHQQTVRQALHLLVGIHGRHPRACLEQLITTLGDHYQPPRTTDGTAS